MLADYIEYIYKILRIAAMLQPVVVTLGYDVSKHQG